MIGYDARYIKCQICTSISDTPCILLRSLKKNNQIQLFNSVASANCGSLVSGNVFKKVYSRIHVVILINSF